MTRWLPVFLAVFVIAPPANAGDPHDWPSYNRDVLGTRYNPAEKTLGKENVEKLVEKWRFPPQDSATKIGVVHCTVVVNGHVYFGTESNPTVYKLTPDGQVKWSYQNTAPRAPSAVAASGLPPAGFLSAALVEGNTVYIGDVGGMLFALDRATGKERWKVDTRSAPFPGAHSSNCIFASPIMADGKLIVAGGGFEHAVGANPKHRCCTGRGFVAAFDPKSGKTLWKYDVGPEPKPLDPPVVIADAFGKHSFHFGPSTSSVWCTPSFDAESHTLFFGTDCHNSPRQPTKDDPRLYTRDSCAIVAIDSRTGAEKWVTQINPDDIWNYSLCNYDKKTGRYKDQSIGDTPKIYTIQVNEKATKVVGCGCKNGGFYVCDAASGKLVGQTPIYTGPPTRPPKNVDPRTLALPSAIGGLQTGCATDGQAIYTNGIDILGMGTMALRPFIPPTGGRVVSISLDTKCEHWRHERPLVSAVGGTKEKPAFTDVGDPVASGIALANGVAYFTTTVSNKLVAINMVDGKLLKEIDLGPVWSGPVVSRGRVYVGTGNRLFAPGLAMEAYFPKSNTGTVISFGLPGEDEVSWMKSGNE